MNRDLPFSNFITKYSSFIVFISVALCLAGIYCALTIPSSVFPQTNFPRVVILVSNGIMPEDEMMATVTKPIEESMKDIPGVETIKSTTGRGSAEISIFFNWKVDMKQSELYVLGRLSQIKSSLPSSVDAETYRLTFSNFPIMGLSVTSPNRSLTDLWEIANYKIKPKFLEIPGVARAELTGGRSPEYQIIIDPVKLYSSGVTFSQIADVLSKNNFVTSAGLHEEDKKLYLTLVDGRIHSIEELENFPVSFISNHPILVKDLAKVVRGPEPAFNYITANGREAVLINIYSQPDGSTLKIAKSLKRDLMELKKELPSDVHLEFFYDQSLLVNSSVRSVWEAIIFGLFLSILIIYFFIEDFRTTLIALFVIPVTVLITLISLKSFNLSFNLMTLGGIAASIGLVIDDAIVVIEAVHTKKIKGLDSKSAIAEAMKELIKPLIGSTLTPVVVFIPLVFLDGITGVFFRALAITMVVSLLTSLCLAMALTPSLALWFTKSQEEEKRKRVADKILSSVSLIYEKGVSLALRKRTLTLSLCGVIVILAIFVYLNLESDFLPEMDEGGFIVDYETPPGTSLSETHRQLKYAEEIIRGLPELESHSRRTGKELGLFITEANKGDFALKLKENRKRKTEEVIAELRHKLNSALPDIRWEFPGILGDVIGDLMKTPQPIEVRIFSTDQNYLKNYAPKVASILEKTRGVVDVFDGLIYTGPSMTFRLKQIEAERMGLSTEDVSNELASAMLGTKSSTILEGDRVVSIRVKGDPLQVNNLDKISSIPIRTPDGKLVELKQVADLFEESGQLELRRDNFREDVAISARLEGRDLGSAMNEIKNKIAKELNFPPGSVEYGGLYEQQQASFKNLLLVLLMAIFLVYTVLLLEFNSFKEPTAIVSGAILSIFGTLFALLVTGTSINVVSLLGAIIGIGITAKNGILMLDFVNELKKEGLDEVEALVRSGLRRLRPVLMTSLAAGLGMIPLAYGIGSGADMLKPMAISVIGALCISIILSLIATPVIYFLLGKRKREE